MTQVIPIHPSSFENIFDWAEIAQPVGIEVIPLVGNTKGAANWTILRYQKRPTVALIFPSDLPQERPVSDQFRELWPGLILRSADNQPGPEMYFADLSKRTLNGEHSCVWQFLEQTCQAHGIKLLCACLEPETEQIVWPSGVVVLNARIYRLFFSPQVITQPVIDREIKAVLLPTTRQVGQMDETKEEAGLSLSCGQT